MKIKAIFENWHIGDGNYPPLSKGEKVNLCFCIEDYIIDTFKTESEFYFNNSDKNKYDFAGTIIKMYSDPPNSLLVINSGDFKFYIEIYKNINKYSEAVVSG